MSEMIAEEFGRIPMSPFLTATLTRAADYARAQMHRDVTLEHVLLSLSEDPEASVILKSSNIDIGRLMSDVSAYLGRMEERVASLEEAAGSISQDLRRVLEAAAAAAGQGRRREINGAIVLAAIVGDGKSPAAHMLRSQGLTFEEAIRALQKAASPPAKPSGSAPRAGTADDIVASARERSVSRAPSSNSTFPDSSSGTEPRLENPDSEPRREGFEATPNYPSPPSPAPAPLRADPSFGAEPRPLPPVATEAPPPMQNPDPVLPGPANGGWPSYPAPMQQPADARLFPM